jgi:two-component system KDP operon response regulator KdpE
MEIGDNRAIGNVLIVAASDPKWAAVETAFREHRFDVRKALTGEDALMRLRRISHAAVVLDLHLPGMGGIGACLRMREEFPDIWIVVVAKEDTVKDRVDALNAGADHYITRPFYVQELTARIQAVIRRARASIGKPNAAIVVGSFYLDVSKRIIEKEGRQIRLSTTEFNLLYQLMANAGQPIPYSLLLDIIWGKHTATERGYLRIYISQLRKKVELIPSEPRYLLTYANVGYVFTAPAAPKGATP